MNCLLSTIPLFLIFLNSKYFAVAATDVSRCRPPAHIVSHMAFIWDTLGPDARGYKQAETTAVAEKSYIVSSWKYKFKRMQDFSIWLFCTWQGIYEEKLRVCMFENYFRCCTILKLSNVEQTLTGGNCTLAQCYNNNACIRFHLEKKKTPFLFI